MPFLGTYGCFLKSDFKKKGGRNTREISRPKSDAASALQLKRELEEFREHGVALYLDGKPSTPKRIARACTIADGSYMRDYTEDEKGRIARVSFDFVSES